MDSRGAARGLIRRNVIDMLPCFIISPPALQRITILRPPKSQTFDKCPTQGRERRENYYFFFYFCDVCECCSSFLVKPPPLSVSPFHPYFRGINLLPGGRGGLQRATSCLLPSGFAESNAKIFIKGCNLSSMEGGEGGREGKLGRLFFPLPLLILPSPSYFWAGGL